ncbi:MAG: AhpC/TSA family protein [Chloroflexota bacterium]|nr:AhpC/TSA family protein [Chloroflexota bacterium]
METVKEQTPLQRELDAAAQQLAEVAPPEAIQTINGGIESLIASGIAHQSLKVGEHAPDFMLPNAAGGTVTLSEVLRAGPVVLVFYRGEWCPYCNLQLRSYQQALPTFKAYNATLLAISPQTPDNSLTTLEQKNLAFPVLSDAGNTVARQYRLAYQVDRGVLETLRGLGIDLSVYNGDEAGELPLTGTFVIDQNSVIRWAAVEADFRRRPDPSEIVAALAAIQRG